MSGVEGVLGASIILSQSASVRADDAPVGAAYRTRGLTGGWGHSWRPVFGQTRSEITFIAFSPRMGWFVTDRLELYGERNPHISNAGTAGKNLGINAATVLTGVEWVLRPSR